MLRWTFVADDFVFQHTAARTSFFHFVFQQYNGHLQPAQFALVWLVTRIAPLDYTAAVAPLVLVTFLAGVLMWMLLGELFGDRPENLLLLTVLLLCPLWLHSSFWWASSIFTVPFVALIVATLLVVLRYLRAPSTPRLVAVGVVYALALALTEKAVFLLPLAALLALLFTGPGSGWARLRSVGMGRWKVWAVLGLLTGAYLPWYMGAVEQAPYLPTMSQMWRLISTAVGGSLIPASLGGPWAESGFPRQVEEPASLVRVLLIGMAFGIIGISMVRYRQAWRAWVLCGVYLALSIAIVAVARLGALFGDPGASALQSRYFADSVPVLALSLGLAFMIPLDRRNDQSWSRSPPRLSDGSVAPYRDEGGGNVEGGSGGRRPSFLLGGLVIAYVVSAAITSTRMLGFAGTYSEAKTWLENVRSELRHHPVASVFDGNLPASVAPLSFQASRLSYSLSPITHHIRWNFPSDRMLIFDASGTLRPIVVTKEASAAQAVGGLCGHEVGAEPVTIKLTRSMPRAWWGVSISYAAERKTTGFVTVDGISQAVTFLSGRHDLTLVVEGRASTVTTSANRGVVCVSDLHVGYVAHSGR
jgi:hypothetical protein